MVTFSRLKELYPDNWQFIARRYKESRNYTCEECGKRYPSNTKYLQVHHIVPLSKGGTSDFSNLQCLCYKCHKAKHPHMGFSSFRSNKTMYSKPFE